MSKFNIGAMWLPAFHKDPHNDQWWGDGFTEWDNVKAAMPLYNGHVQPVKPLDGYTEINTIEEILRQFIQASNFGISVIGCYHYWFEGERLLNVPENLLLGKDDLPVQLFLYWANHSWSRAWTNTSGDPGILIEQTYSISDAKNHAEYTSRFINKKFYYERDGKPVFFIYDGIDLFKKSPNYLDVFRRVVLNKTGKILEIVVSVRSKSELDIIKGMPKFYDKLFIFEPSFSLSKLKNTGLLYKYFYSLPDCIKNILIKIYRKYDKTYITYDYENISCIDHIRSDLDDGGDFIYSVCCGFDNTPRYRKNARIFENFSPAIFKNKFEKTLKYSIEKKINLILINALNEWGEGMHLQPCKTHGDLKLKAVKMVYDEFN